MIYIYYYYYYIILLFSIYDNIFIYSYITIFKRKKSNNVIYDPLFYYIYLYRFKGKKLNLDNINKIV